MFFLFVSIIKLIFLSNDRYDSSNQSGQQKICACGGWLSCSVDKHLLWSMHWMRDSSIFTFSAIYFDFAPNSKLLILNHQYFDPLHQNLIKNRELIENFSTRKSFFLPCISILIVFKFKWNNFIFNVSRNSNSCFIKTPGFISSIRIGTEKVLVVGNFSRRELSIWVACISVLTVKEIPEVLPFPKHDLYMRIGISIQQKWQQWF